MVPDLTAGSRRLSACSADTMNHAGFLDINWGKTPIGMGRKPQSHQQKNVRTACVPPSVQRRDCIAACWTQAHSENVKFRENPGKELWEVGNLH